MHVDCPGCGRQIQFVAEEVGQTFECSACGAFATAAEPQARTFQPDLVYEQPRTGLTPAVKRCLMALGAGFLLVATVGGLTWFFVSQSDPWPECATIREWLRTNSNDPKSIEIVEWEHRDPLVNGGASIEVRMRGRNGMGALMISRTRFTVREGKVTATEMLH